jgi:hypothetical protein
VIAPVLPPFRVPDHHVRLDDVGCDDLRIHPVGDRDEAWTDTDIGQIQAPGRIRLDERRPAAERFQFDGRVEFVVPPLLFDDEVLHHREHVDRPQRE